MSFNKNHYIDEESVREHLTEERLEIFYNCISASINYYQEKHKDDGHIFLPRTKANAINDIMANNIKKSFESDPDVYIFYARGRSLRLSINNGAVVVRFKKMDKNMTTHNIPTQQALDFNEQLTLFGNSININAGYISTGFDHKIVVACPENNNQNFWAWEVESAVANLENVTIFPVAISAQSTALPKRKVVPRREKKEHEGVNE
ncbi:MAG: hypothetical protein H6Q72_1688 [Firmicutes bacterium]|nr:hypothetical protein [Bacillota bacterium]